MAAPVEVCLSWPEPGELDVDVGARVSQPGVRVVQAPYREDPARRAARARGSLGASRTDAPLPRPYREALATAEVLLARDVPVDVVRLAPRLRWVQCVYSGVEHLRGAGLEDGGIVVTNASGCGASSIAEFTVARLLMVWKRLREIDDAQRDRRWQPVFGDVVGGACLVLVGLGAIGTAVAQRAAAFGMRVVAVRRRGAAGGVPPGVALVVGPDELETALAMADAVVLAVPTTAATRGWIDAGALAAMRPGAVLCNVGRGDLVDEEALVRALRTGRLRAAVLDTFSEEPLPADSPLWDLPNAYLSAHCSVNVDQYAREVVDLFADNLARHLDGRPLRNVVDLERGY